MFETKSWPELIHKIGPSSSSSPSRGVRLPGYPPLPLSSSSGMVYDAQASATLSPEASVFYTEPLEEAGREVAKRFVFICSNRFIVFVCSYMVILI
jgi:hypothetical protein